MSGSVCSKPSEFGPSGSQLLQAFLGVSLDQSWSTHWRVFDKVRCFVVKCLEKLPNFGFGQVQLIMFASAIIQQQWNEWTALVYKKHLSKILVRLTLASEALGVREGLWEAMLAPCCFLRRRQIPDSAWWGAQTYSSSYLRCWKRPYQRRVSNLIFNPWSKKLLLEILDSCLSRRMNGKARGRSFIDSVLNRKSEKIKSS